MQENKKGGWGLAKQYDHEKQKRQWPACSQNTNFSFLGSNRFKMCVACYAGYDWTLSAQRSKNEVHA